MKNGAILLALAFALVGCGSSDAAPTGKDAVDTKGLTNGPSGGREAGAGMKKAGDVEKKPAADKKPDKP